MKVKLTTIGALLLLGVLLFFGVYGYAILYRSSPPEESVKEGFVDAPLQTNGIAIQACPADSVAFVNQNGDTLCCQGGIAEGKCVGREICSLSGTQKGGMPTCSEWLSAHLQEKGRGRCPATMPTYFEGPTGVRGCTDGLLNKTGTSPDSSKSRKCTLYSRAADDNEKLDSCANVKYLDQAICFPGMSVQANKMLVPTERGLPPLVQCSMVEPVTKVPIACTTNESYARYKNLTRDTLWKTKINKADVKSGAYLNKLDFCSAAYTYKVQKSKPMKDLETEIVFP